MSKNKVNSDSWTGGLPPPAGPKPVTRFQYVFALLLGIFGVPMGLTKLCEGCLTGRIQIPLRGSYGHVATSHPALFTLCILGWLAIIFIAGGLISFSVKGLTGATRR